ncbi:uncharacterized protein LOC113646045 isoform X3 [Tachysurus ichikawai]
MTLIWTIVLFLNTMYSAKTVEISRTSVLSVKSGERVTLNCPFGDNRKAESVVWYKLILGEMPQKIGERLAYKDINISTEFMTSGFKIEASDNRISLTIQQIKKEDGGLYYCGKCNMDEVALSNGTFLAVTGN